MALTKCHAHNIVRCPVCNRKPEPKDYAQEAADSQLASTLREAAPSCGSRVSRAPDLDDYDGSTGWDNR